MNTCSTPSLIAISGGSGAGKTWLAGRLQAVFGPAATRLSLDDFYQDRSHLTLKQCARINFDHPRAIDWSSVVEVLHACRAGRPARLSRYDFASHSRLAAAELWQPKPLVFVEGLWLLKRPEVRRLFDLKVFIQCDAPLRLQQRLQRDVAERGRTPASVQAQFTQTVAPMHDRYVAPDARWADVILNQPLGEPALQSLVERIRSLPSAILPRTTRCITHSQPEKIYGTF